MPRATSKTPAARARAFGLFVLHLAPALGLLVLAGTFNHPAVLVLLLLANSLVMAAVCEAVGFGLESAFTRTVLRRGAAHFVLFAGYVGAVMLLVGFPLLWLLQAPSLEATLSLSAATVLALFLLWRVWPVFGLVFLWDDAYPESSGSWLYGAIKRCFAFALHLTGEHELFFSHGLPVSLILLFLAQAALSIAGFCGLLPSEFRIAAIAVYGLFLPVAHWLVANRTLRALLVTRRANRISPVASAVSSQPAEIALPLPSGLAPPQLNAALLRAARAGHIELCLAALERGADPTTVPPPEDRDQRSVLVLAALFPEIRLLRALIAKHVDVNQRHQSLTPLLAATRDSHAGRPDAVLTLLANGADTAQSDSDGNTPLHHAARAAEPTVAAMLLDAGAPLSAVNREGYTPLCCAAAASNATLLKFLLERGAKAEVEQAVPALVAAASIAEDDVTILKTLLKQKAKVDARAPLGRTALMMAALMKHRAMAKALLDAGADPQLADQQGTTAPMEAARSGSADIVGLFAGRKTDINLRDTAGRTALIIACQSRQANLETVKALMALGADTSIVARDGKRAVDAAALSGRWDIVATLDPGYPLPTHVIDIVRGTPLPGTDSPAHLLDALRFGHTKIAEGFRDTVRQWIGADQAEILHALGEDDDRVARAWLLAHGVPADVMLADGTRVLDAWLTRLPHTLAACHDLLNAGASTGGAGKARLVLEAAREAPAHHSRLLHLAQEWLARGGDPFAANANGETALHLAAELSASDCAEWLLQRGANPNVRDTRGATPLHAALRAPGIEAVRIAQNLVRHGADPSLATINGETCLGLGLARGEPDLQRWLQWRGWPLPQRAVRSPDLPAAALTGDAEAVGKLIELGLPVDAVDQQGASALLRACGLGHLELVKQLLGAGADAAFAAPTGATCLSAAVSARREAVVRALLEHGVDPNQRLPGGGTALMIAAALGFPEITETLLAAGADPNLADEKGTTALHALGQFAFAHSDTARTRSVLQALCRYGALPNLRNAKGQTPLLLFLGARADPGTPCQAAHLAALLPILLDHAADLDMRDDRGVSPLHACAIHGLLAPAQQLLARGALRDALDCLGRTPGNLAHVLGYAELAQQLGGAAPVPSLAQMLRAPARPVE